MDKVFQPNLTIVFGHCVDALLAIASEPIPDDQLDLKAEVLDLIETFLYAAAKIPLKNHKLDEAVNKTLSLTASDNHSLKVIAPALRNSLAILKPVATQFPLPT